MNTGLTLSLVELVGDYGTKIQSLPLALIGYNVLAFTLFKIMGTPGATLTLVNSNWDGISNLCTTILGAAMGEKFSPRQYLGIFLISAGLFLVNVEEWRREKKAIGKKKALVEDGISQLRDFGFLSGWDFPIDRHDPQDRNRVRKRRQRAYLETYIPTGWKSCIWKNYQSMGYFTRGKYKQNYKITTRFKRRGTTRKFIKQLVLECTLHLTSLVVDPVVLKEYRINNIILCKSCFKFNH